MPFNPYEFVGIVIPDELITSGNAVILQFWGDRDDEKWSISLNDPTLSLPVYGSLRVDPSLSRDQVIEVARNWITSACAARGISAAAFQHKGGMFKGARESQTDFVVQFQIQRL